MAGPSNSAERHRRPGEEVAVVLRSAWPPLRGFAGLESASGGRFPWPTTGPRSKRPGAPRGSVRARGVTSLGRGNPDSPGCGRGARSAGRATAACANTGRKNAMSVPSPRRASRAFVFWSQFLDARRGGHSSFRALSSTRVEGGLRIPVLSARRGALPAPSRTSRAAGRSCAPAPPAAASPPPARTSKRQA